MEPSAIPPAPTDAARRRIRYLALIRPVQEVSLSGVADMDFWRRHLAQADLEPVGDADGAAQVWVAGAEMKFQFQRFCEVSVAVVARIPGESEAGFFLLHAFNTNRWFAWCEQHLFSAPYGHQHCRLAVSLPLAISVGGESKPILRAAMDSHRHPSSELAQTHWDGRVHLPRHSRHEPHRFFYALTSGLGHTWEFLGGDHFELNHENVPPAWRCLADSGFRPRRWTCRLDATHGKSRTHRRP